MRNMRALVQRVKWASVTVEEEPPRKIGPGLMILLGVQDADTPTLCQKLAEKCAGLRIFEDDAGKMNLSALELGYSALVVSNFTLYADTKKGKRPSFTRAAKPPLSVKCYETFLELLRGQGLREVKSGEFGAYMQIELCNDGPVTVLLDTDDWNKI